MKLKSLFASFLGLATVLAGCSTDPIGGLDEVQVSNSYIQIADGGSSESIVLTASDAWSFATDIPAWLSVAPTSGLAGETTVTFSADPAEATRTVDLKISVAGKTQYITVTQAVAETEVLPSTVAEVNEGPNKTYMVKGTVDNIVNTEYGNWYLKDDTGSLYIYGTLDKNGATKNFASLGLEVGDIVTVKGPKVVYNGTIELSNVTVLEIVKSLIKVETEPVTVEKDGGNFDVKVTCKGEGVSVEIPEDAKSWLSIAAINSTATGATVTFNAAANNAGDRSTTVTFSTTSKGQSYTGVLSVAQLGAIIDATAADINAAEDGSTQYRLTGYVSSIASDTYGNLYIKDATGEVYVYGTLDADGNAKNFSSLGIKAGDIITVVGPKASYNGKSQMKNVSVESHKAVTDVTVSEFLSKGADKNIWYRIKGAVSGIKDTDVYGNFDIADETDKVYVYGLVAGWGGASKQFQSLGIKEGDTVTLVGVRAEYKGAAQVGSAFLIEKESGEVTPPEPPTVSGTPSVTLTFPDDNAENNKVNGYIDPFTSKIGANEFTISGFNNYEWNGWTYIRTSRKNTPCVGSIANATPLTDKIVSVVVTIGSRYLTSVVDSFIVKAYSDAALTAEVCSVATDKDAVSTNSDVTFAIPADKQAAGLYYVVELNCNGSNEKNGQVEVSKVTYNK